MTDTNELARRIDYLTSTVTDAMLMRGVSVSFEHPKEWLCIDRDPLEELTGLGHIEIVGGDVTLAMCPGLLVRVTAALPWSSHPAGAELVLDEDDMPEPDGATVSIAPDADTASDARCPVCAKVHGTIPPVVEHETWDDPTADPYWFFDNFVRLLVVIAETELLTYAYDETSTPAARASAAWERLYLIHPAVHRFMAEALLAGVDLAYQP